MDTLKLIVQILMSPKTFKKKRAIFFSKRNQRLENKMEEE